MRDNLIAYVTALVIMAGMDFCWFSMASEPVYQRVLGTILAEKINYPAAASFYLMYALGVVIFAIRPALESGDWRTALVRGALFGFFAYATYDLTNLAALKIWSIMVSIIDVAWGVFVTGAVASASAAITLALEK